MLDSTLTDRPGFGDNTGAPYGEAVTERLEADYGALLEHTRGALMQAELLPEQVRDSADVTRIAAIAVTLRDLAARSESHRKAEKEPYLRSGEMVDAFFFRRIQEPANAKRKVLTARIDTFKQRQLAEERARRQREAEIARQAQLAAERQRLEAEAAARRARSAETLEQRQQEADKACVEADLAERRAEETTLATMARATTLVGERFEGERSGLVGMRKTPVVYIEDAEQLDLERLRPYLKLEALEAALRAWARATDYQETMPGAVCERRDATVVR